MALLSKKKESPSPKDVLCHIWLKLTLRFLDRRFLSFVNVFSSTLGKGFPFIWMNLNLLLPMKLCAKIGGNWPSSSTEEDFLNFFSVFSLFSLLSPLRKGRGPSFEKVWIPLHPKTLCANFGWNWHTLWFLRRSKKCDSQADGPMTGNQISSLELFAQMS